MRAQRPGVKRWTPINTGHEEDSGACFEDEGGAWVKYTDYAALESQLVQLRVELEAAQRGDFFCEEGHKPVHYYFEGDADCPMCAIQRENERLLEKALKAAEDEPNLPGEMPEGFRKEFEKLPFDEALRIVVALTKSGIRGRIKAALAATNEKGV